MEILLDVQKHATKTAKSGRAHVFSAPRAAKASGERQVRHRPVSAAAAVQLSLALA
jgi:hypothetical protein